MSGAKESVTITRIHSWKSQRRDPALHHHVAQLEQFFPSSRNLPTVSREEIPAGQGTKILDTWYPVVNVGENFGSAAVLAQVTGYKAGAKTHYLSIEQVERALGHFAPFLGDGKYHANIVALQSLRQALLATKNINGVEVPRQVVVQLKSP